MSAVEYHVQSNREDEVALLSHHHKATNSWFSTSCLIVCAMAGIGVLGLPAALFTTGWIGLVILVLVCVMSAYTGVIIGRTLKVLPRGTGYTEMGNVAFGTPGRLFADFSIYTTLGGVGIIFLILLGLLMEGIVPRVSHGFWTLAFGLVIVGPISIGLRSYGEIKWISFFGFAATAVVVVIATVLSLVFMYGSEYAAFQRTWGFHTTLVQGKSFFIGMSVFAFAFGSQAIYPNIYVQMTDPSRWSFSVVGGYIATFFLYIPISVAGYAAYGEFLGNKDHSSTILSTIQFFDVKLDILIRILSGIMIFHIVTAFPVVVNPLFSAMENYWFKKRGHQSFKLNLLTRIIIFLVMLVLALFFPYFLDIMSLISCLSVCLSCFILPCLFYWKICHPPLWERAALTFIILFGVVAAVCGTVVAVQELVADVHSNPNPFKGLFNFS